MRRRARPPGPFTVEYVPLSADDSPDQLLTIKNNTEMSVQPTLSFSARDLWGRELPGVAVQTVNGSHRGGGPLLAAGGTLVDILRFDGIGARHVRGVDVQLAAAEQSDHPALEADIKTVMIDLEQKATADPEEFWGVGMVNPNPFGVTVRVSLVEFEDRHGDDPRQAVDVVTLQEDIDMASVSNHVIWLPEDVRGRFHAVTHHLRPESLL
ncbi:hypothetical protein C6I20_04260 [Aeromicrobium sp. A1-2]|uniref:hypothetical protein n=1 Tax=Aeromicrobium sp. A1-2 TaxID=2107713 RepID=UPI000E4CE494|nr:hypothetical protein [Aeromicrobium sp. A1-2]AXT84486.1 hypothetical protein C6I20_04260 [Aeromicrobium sp. A1-2]